jgi:hypothetical protein
VAGFLASEPRKIKARRLFCGAGYHDQIGNPGFNSVKNKPASNAADVAKQCDEAKQRRDQLTASLPKLTNEKQSAEQQVTAAKESLDRAEDNEEPEAKIAPIRARHDAAVIEHRKARHALRMAREELLVLDDTIERLSPEAIATDVKERAETYTRHVLELREAILEAARKSAVVAQDFAEAEGKYPHVVRRANNKPLGYPLYGGLIPLAWAEFRNVPEAIDGGRLGHWLKMVEEFINPKPAAPPKQRRESPFPVASAAPASAALVSGLDEVSKARLHEGK